MSPLTLLTLSPCKALPFLSPYLMWFMSLHNTLKTFARCVTKSHSPSSRQGNICPTHMLHLNERQIFAILMEVDDIRHGRGEGTLDSIHDWVQNVRIHTLEDIAVTTPETLTRL